MSDFSPKPERGDSNGAAPKTELYPPKGPTPPAGNSEGPYVCGRCCQQMRFNVPRLGPDGGFVHFLTGKLTCDETLLPVVEKVKDEYLAEAVENLRISIEEMVDEKTLERIGVSRDRDINICVVRICGELTNLRDRLKARECKLP